MKKIKSLNVNIDNPLTIYSEHSIYELTDEEMKKSGIYRKYLLNRTYSKYAMDKMDYIDLLKTAERESEYVYGVYFANTIEEAELAYKNAVLECRILDFQNEMKRIVKKLIDSKESLCDEICFDTMEK